MGVGGLPIWLLFKMALATAALSITVTKSSLFLPFRRLLGDPQGNWFAKLFNCPYCMSHWIAIGFLGMFIFMFPALTMLVVDVFVVIAIAAVGCGVIRFAMKLVQG